MNSTHGVAFSTCASYLTRELHWPEPAVMVKLPGAMIVGAGGGGSFSE